MSMAGGTAPPPCTARCICDNAEAISVLSPHPISLNPSTLAGRPAGSKDAEARKRREQTAAEKESKAARKRRKKQAGNEAAKKAFVDAMVSSPAVHTHHTCCHLC